MPLQRVTLHIGAHKTASSLLQSALRIHVEPLLRDGLQVTHRNQIMESPLDTVLWSIASPEQARQPIPPAVVQWIADQAKDAPANWQMTNEDFFNNPSTPEFFTHIGPRLEFVRRCFPSSSVAVILYTRSQADYVESLYMQHVHVGRTPKFSSFVTRFAESDLSWRRVADEIAAVVGDANTIVAPYESIKRIGDVAFYREFLRRCGISTASSYTFDSALPRSRGANRSYSALALQIATRVNPLLKPDERPLLRRFLQENFSNVTHQRAVLFSPEERADFLARFHVDNMQLFESRMADWAPERTHY